MARRSPAKRKYARNRRRNTLLTRQLTAMQQLAVTHFQRAKQLQHAMLHGSTDAPTASDPAAVITVITPETPAPVGDAPNA